MSQAAGMQASAAIRERVERIQPYNEEVERAVLGALMLEPVEVGAIFSAEMRLSPEAFYVRGHQKVAEVILEMLAAGEHVDLVTVCARLKAQNQIDAVGGAMQLTTYVDQVTSVRNAHHHIGVLRGLWIQRRVIQTAREIIDEGYSSEDGEHLLHDAPQRFVEITERVETPKSNREVMLESYAEWESVEKGEKEMIGLRTGVPFLDRALGGLQPGLILLAGRPSAGKTTLEAQIADGLARQGMAVARVTVDMDRKRLLQRSICREAGVSLPKLQKGFAGEANKASVAEAIDVIASWPVYIREADRELRSICSWARAMKMKHDIQLLTVDYAQQIKASHLDTRFMGEYQEVSYVSGTFKALAAELGICVMLLSQLSRAGEKDNRPPKLSDLRGSGSLEQDAMAALFCWKYMKFDYEAANVEEHRKRATIVEVAKNQDGECAEQEFWLHAPYFRFEEADPDWGVVSEDDGKKKKGR
jgi:replicative DNA helicase